MAFFQKAEVAKGEAYTSEFLMWRYKIELCTREDNHDWARCPFAHEKEKAKRRDPRRFKYMSLPCPDIMQGINPCPRGDACQYTHSVQEYWLHPDRFKTQMCKNGAHCNRPLCFFAHRAEELRFPITVPVDRSASYAADGALTYGAAAAGAGGATYLVSPATLGTAAPPLQMQTGGASLHYPLAGAYGGAQFPVMQQRTGSFYYGPDGMPVGLVQELEGRMPLGVMGPPAPVAMRQQHQQHQQQHGRMEVVPMAPAGFLGAAAPGFVTGPQGITLGQESQLYGQQQHQPHFVMLLQQQQQQQWRQQEPQQRETPWYVASADTSAATLVGVGTGMTGTGWASSTRSTGWASGSTVTSQDPPGHLGQTQQHPLLLPANQSPVLMYSASVMLPGPVAGAGVGSAAAQGQPVLTPMGVVAGGMPAAGGMAPGWGMQPGIVYQVPQQGQGYLGGGQESMR